MDAIEISKRPYDQGVRALRETPNKKKKPLSKHTIYDALTNRAAIGEFQPMKTTKADSVRK